MDAFSLSDIPEEFTAGDAIKWTISLPDYPAGDGWVLSYALLKSDKQITFSGSADGDNHVIELDSSDTVAWTPGLYAWQAFVTNAESNRVKWAEGIIEIKTNFATATTGAAVLPNCFIQLEAVDAVMNERATESQSSMAVEGRQISEMSHDELLNAKARLRSECNQWRRRNRRARGKSTGGKVKATFTME